MRTSWSSCFFLNFYWKTRCGYAKNITENHAELKSRIKEGSCDPFIADFPQPGGVDSSPLESLHAFRMKLGSWRRFPWFSWPCGSQGGPPRGRRLWLWAGPSSPWPARSQGRTLPGSWRRRSPGPSSPGLWTASGQSSGGRLRQGGPGNRRCRTRSWSSQTTPRSCRRRRKLWPVSWRSSGRGTGQPCWWSWSCSAGSWTRSTAPHRECAPLKWRPPAIAVRRVEPEEEKTQFDRYRSGRPSPEQWSRVDRKSWWGPSCWESGLAGWWCLLFWISGRPVGPWECRRADLRPGRGQRQV